MFEIIIEEKIQKADRLIQKFLEIYFINFNGKAYLAIKKILKNGKPTFKKLPKWYVKNYKHLQKTANIMVQNQVHSQNHIKFKVPTYSHV